MKGVVEAEELSLTALLEGSTTGSDRSEPVDVDSDDADLQRILDEDDDEDALLPFAADGSAESMAERRRALDKLLEQADAIVGPSSPSSAHVVTAASAAAPALAAEEDAAAPDDNDAAPMTPPWSTATIRPDVVGSSSRGSRAPPSRRPMPSLRNRATPSVAGEQQQEQQQQRSRVAQWVCGVGSPLLHVATLDAMAEEASESLERGRPTAVALHASHVAVGMSRGGVLLFDRRQNLQTMLWEPRRPYHPSSSSLSSSFASSLLGSSSLGSSLGVRGTTPGASVDAVTALRIAEGTGGFLLAGHHSGRLVLWDLNQKTVLKECNELHGASISHIRFLAPGRPHALTVDAGGTAHLTSFSLLLMSYSVSRQVISTCACTCRVS